jgi:hypothetical protein
MFVKDLGSKTVEGFIDIFFINFNFHFFIIYSYFAGLVIFSLYTSTGVTYSSKSVCQGGESHGEGL